jgi:hypothetical protein
MTAFRLLAFHLLSVLASPGTHALQADFDTYEQTRSLFPDSSRYRLVLDSGRTALQATRADSSSATYLVHTFQTDSVAGGVYRISASSRAFGLTRKPARFNGVKAMLSVRRADGSTIHPQLSWPDTLPTYGWTRSTMVVAIPENTTKADIALGLELVAGTVLFDSLRMERIGSVAMPPPRDPSLAIPRPFGFRARGAMANVPLDSASIAIFGSDWKGNVLRWQMNGGSGVDSALLRPDYDALLEREFARIDQALPACRAHGIGLILDMHQMASGLFLGAAAQERLITAWSRIAQRYKDHESVIGYDLANEPPEGQWREGALLWNELADTLCRTIRAIDPFKPIVVEPVLSDLERFAQLRPIGSDRGWDLANIVYSFHFYLPYSLTHQGIGPAHPPLGAVYPGTIDGTLYDSTRLHQAMRPAIAYQDKYRVPIYVGEFSCIRWAPQGSAHRWLRDATSIFEHEGWDWTYHAYREYHGWSVEHSDSMTDLRGGQDTDRKALLLGLFQRNAPASSRSSEPRRPVAGSDLGPWIHPQDGRLVVHGIPEGETFEVRDLRGSVLARIPGPSGAFAPPKVMAFCRISGPRPGTWRLLPGVGLLQGKVHP